MPCMYINSYILNQGATSGCVTVTMGTANNGDVGLINYSHNYSTGAYYIPASYLVDIPDNAKINKIAFQYVMASSKTYSVPEITSFMYVHPPNTNTSAFPDPLLNTGYSSSNNVYNNSIDNYTAVLPETSSYSFTSPSVVNPAGEYIDLPFVNSLTYKAGYDIAMTFINNSGSKTGTPNGSTPFVPSVDLGWVGDIEKYFGANYFFRQEKDGTVPYTIPAVTVKDQFFRPNVKICWNNEIVTTVTPVTPTGANDLQLSKQGLKLTAYAPVSFVTDYSYAGHMIQASELSGIPNNSMISGISYQYLRPESLLYGTYTTSAVIDVYKHQVPGGTVYFNHKSSINGHAIVNTDTLFNGTPAENTPEDQAAVDQYNADITDEAQISTNSAWGFTTIGQNETPLEHQESNQWRRIDFDTPFAVDNTKNLVIIINTKSSVGAFKTGTTDPYFTFPVAKGTELNNGQPGSQPKVGGNKQFTATSYYGTRNKAADGTDPGVYDLNEPVTSDYGTSTLIREMKPTWYPNIRLHYD